MDLTYDTALPLLSRHGQAHILRFWSRLNDAQKKDLLTQVESLDFDGVRAMRALLASRGVHGPGAAIEPGPVWTLTAAERQLAGAAGEAALRAGQVGVLLVAGGQGSRLGFVGPKGAFPVGPITQAPLFAIHARKILALEQRFGKGIPFYIMTSRENDGPTREFFRRHRHFGLSEERVCFFVQGMWPALDERGLVVLDRPDRLFMSPDGHGGTLAALRTNGMLDNMAGRGLTTLFYFQVDNPLVEVADSVFIGAHLERQSDVSVKVCAKRDPDEGLGVVAVRNGRSAVVEYTELTPEQKHEKGPDGRLKFLFGSVAIHVFALSFLQRAAARRLPLHLAHKKVPCCDENGATVKPAAPNAYKFEQFIFDVLPDAERALNVEFAREEEFSPVKNASGLDSADTARRDMMLKFARWFESCGVAVPRDADGRLRHRLEIDPCYALGPEDLKGRLPAGFTITGDTLLA